MFLVLVHLFEERNESNLNWNSAAKPASITQAARPQDPLGPLV